MKKALMLLWLFMIGGDIYYLIEMMWRGFSHPAMYFVGGICFVLIGLINEHLTFDMSLLLQGLIATGIVLVIELISGLVLNVWLELAVWDYSSLPGNLLGQICVPFAALWYALSIAGIIIDDYLRYWFFDEEKPRYRII
jgi:uncharacterized membrane protein